VLLHAGARTEELTHVRTVVASDGLLGLEVGPWTADKLAFLRKYIDLFNHGMKKKWQLRVYIDLFAGPGVNVVRPGGEEIDGSPLVALKSQVPFTHCFFNDLDPHFVAALRTRAQMAMDVRKPGAATSVEFLNCDCNEAAREIARRMPAGCLALAFVDPWKWELTFNSVASLTRGRRVDLLQTFHTGSIKRSAHRVLRQVDNSVGGTDWRNQYQQARRGEKSRVILDYFERSLAQLGYPRDNVDDRVLMRNSRNTPMYHIVYASKHPRGKDFWEKVSAILPSGQRRLL
jgi:three-Cys-motif partner protein